MSTSTILFFAIFVFVLMIIGIYLTSLEFKRLTEEQRALRRSRGQRDSARVHRGVEATDTA